MNTRRMLLTFLIAFPAAAIGNDPGQHLSGNTERFGPPMDANALVLSDTYGVCSDRYFGGVRHVETQGDMVRGELRFGLPGEMESVTYDLGRHYGFGKRVSARERISIDGRSRNVGIITQGDLTGYVISDVYPDEEIEVAIWFDRESANALRQAKQLAIAVAACTVRINDG